MKPILDITKIKKWITNDTLLDHAPNTHTELDTIQNNPFPHTLPKIPPHAE